MRIRNRKFFFNIFLASLAMTGFVILLTVWFLNAYSLKKELFEYRVNVALKSIVNQMVEMKHQNNKAVFCEHFCIFQNQNVLEHIDKDKLDSIIVAEFNSLGIDPVYNYTVFRERDKEVIISSNSFQEPQMFNSPFKISLSCVSSCADPSDFFYLSFVFPDNNMFIFRQLVLSVIIALVLFLVPIYSYYRTIMYYLKLLRLSDMKADFINNMTHEFKTPLATISIAGEMLQKEKVTEDKAMRDKYLRIIKSENERLKGQVNKILQIAMIEKKELAYTMESCNVHTLLEQCVRDFDIIIKERGARVQIHADAQLAQVNADKVHLYNVFSNLTDNALKYNASNQPDLTISTLSDNSNIIITFTDNGIGIAKTSLKDIFKQFYRVPTGDLHNVKGFGLGLFYVKMVLKSFGGTVSAESEIGKGTEFTIVLPLLNK